MVAPAQQPAPPAHAPAPQQPAALQAQLAATTAQHAATAAASTEQPGGPVQVQAAHLPVPAGSAAPAAAAAAASAPAAPKPSALLAAAPATAAHPLQPLAQPPKAPPAAVLEPGSPLEQLRHPKKKKKSHPDQQPRSLGQDMVSMPHGAVSTHGVWTQPDLAMPICSMHLAEAHARTGWHQQSAAGCGLQTYGHTCRTLRPWRRTARMITPLSPWRTTLSPTRDIAAWGLCLLVIAHANFALGLIVLALSNSSGSDVWLNSCSAPQPTLVNAVRQQHAIAPIMRRHLEDAHNCKA